MKASLIEISWLRDHIHYDPDLGEFRSKGGTFYFDGSVRRLPKAGVTLNQTRTGAGYLEVRFSVVRELAHRLAWALHHGEWPASVIDHIDGNPSNNRISNLRDVSQSVNAQNIKGPKGRSRSGLLGAHSYLGDRFRSSIVVGGVKVYLGTFLTEIEAHEAYLEARRKHHPGNTL